MTHTPRDSTPRPSAALRVVVLTTGSATGLRVLGALAEREIELAAIVVEARVRVADCYRAVSWPIRVLETPLAIARALRRRSRLRSSLARSLAHRAAIVVVGDRGSRQALDKMVAMRPDILVLAGVGIVTEAMLAIPRLGTLNGHPALLPWVRGNGVVLHSIKRGVAIGAACHRVDAGIDTGPVLEQRLLRVATDDTLESLEARAVELATELLADVVAGAVARGALASGETQRERFPLSRWGDRNARSEVARRVNDGAARELFSRWKACCADDSLDLPARIPVACLPPLTMPASNLPTRAREAVVHDRG